jgi:hypothetical protein
MPDMNRPVTHEQTDPVDEARCTQPFTDRAVVSCRSLTKRYGDVLAADEYQAQ